MSGTIAFFPNVARCELCECQPARANFEGLWICEACLDQVRAAPAPLPTPARSDDPRFAGPLEEIVDQLLRTTPE